MTDKILDFEPVQEDVIENYEEFDYLTDFYLPFQEQEAKYNSSILKGFRENNLDPYEYIGETKVNGIQPIKLLKPEEEEQGKIDYSEAFIEFFKDIPESVALSTLENIANITNLGVQAVGVASNLAFKDTKLDKISDITNSAASFYNRNTEQFVKNIETYAKNNDINGVSKFITDIGIDTGLSFPIYKQLKKVGVPSFAAMPLSFGLAYGFSGGEKEIDGNMIMDSQAINRTFELLNILPDTPESEIAEAVATAFEGTLWTAAIGPLTKTFKLLKNNVPAYINQQTAVSVGGATATTEAVNQFEESRQENLNVEDQNQNLTEEKKNLNQSSDFEEIDGLMASAGFGPVFKSILKETAKKLSNKGSGEQFLNQLKNTQGLKQQELKWSGLDDFLKDKKSVTKEEVKEFLQNNSLDVSEVKFGGPQRELLQSITKNRLEFEKRWLKQTEKNIGEKFNFKTEADRDLYVRTNLDYDNYEVLDLSDNTYLKIPFGQMKTYFGDDFAKGIKEGQAAKSFKGPEGQNFEISKLELDKFNIEDQVRSFRQSGSAPKFEQYTEAGGKDYTELVFRLKVGGKDIGIPIEAIQERPAFDAAGKVFMEKSLPSKALVPFKNPAHMNVKNEIAHVRFKTRELDDLKVLSVEEMQSDFAIAAKKKLKDYKKITDFPFRNNWYELTIKRLLRYAADNGFDAVAIPKGSVAAKRYGESINTAYKIMYSKTDDQIMLSYLDQNGVSVADMSYANADKALNVLKKDVGEKFYNQILKTDKSGNSFIDFDKPIVVGSGKGKYELYDKAIPSFIKKYTKKWNAEVYVDDVDDIPVTIIKLTDDMKQSVQQDGQALFSIFGIGAGAKIASDSMQNNIILEQTN